MSVPGISIRPRGLPAVASRSDSSTEGATGAPADRSMSRSASARSSPASTSSSSPVASRPSGRVARRNATGSTASRRAANSSASRDASSSQCASSTTTSTGSSSAAPAIRLRVAAATAKRSFCDGSERPRAEERAAACTDGSASRLPSSGRQISTRPENSSCASDSYPVARSTSIASERSTAWRNRADLPAPGSPRRTIASLVPARADPSKRSIRSISRSRP